MNQDDVLAALSTVQDPELRRSVVDLGMVRDIEITDERLSVRLVLTTAACPLKGRIETETGQALAAVADGRRVEVVMDAMSPEECARLAAAVKADSGIPPTPFGPGSKTRVLAVASGKGGVGKSTVTANLAVALARRGHAVGLIDADVYGPTIPLMFGMAAVAPASHDGKLVPPERHGVKVVSMGFFLEEDEPVIWRGPMLGRAMEQFLGDVLWGSPDYLLIDLPPGTGDIALTIAQMLPSAEVIVVTTPQEAAAKIAAKAAKMALLTKHRIIGVSRTWRTSFVLAAARNTSSSVTEGPSRSPARSAPPFWVASRSKSRHAVPATPARPRHSTPPAPPAPSLMRSRAPSRRCRRLRPRPSTSAAPTPLQDLAAAPSGSAGANGATPRSRSRWRTPRPLLRMRVELVKFSGRESDEQRYYGDLLHACDRSTLAAAQSGGATAGCEHQHLAPLE